MDQVCLLKAFGSGADFNSMMHRLAPALTNSNSAAAAVLALEGLFRIEADVESEQYQYASDDTKETIREFLRKWRCESPLLLAYSSKKATKFLRSLTIFRKLGVPLFIDSYGKKRLMSHYSAQLEIIPIDRETPIVHITHTEQKEQILEEQMFTPSNNKNAIEGIWFSPKYQLGEPPSSVYGNWAFETTLRKLDVSGLRQGEIVSYKQEVNFILYASNTVSQVLLQKATDSAVKTSQENPRAYTTVSIFVPSRFLPKQAEEFQSKITKPYSVSHRSFCVKQKRGVVTKCKDLVRTAATPELGWNSDPDSDPDSKSASRSKSKSKSNPKKQQQ
jgi:hypothetical protein